MSEVNSQLDVCNDELKWYSSDLSNYNADQDYFDRKQPSYKQYSIRSNSNVDPFEEFDKIIKSEKEAKEETKKVGMEIPKIELPEVNKNIIFGIVLFGSILSYLVVFSGYKSALAKH